MSIGTQLRTAREARGIGVSDAAAATRMKPALIEALEGEHFDRFAAPIYAQGFIKIYAEYLGLDPAPLLREYAERQPSKPPPVVPLPPLRPPPSPARTDARADAEKAAPSQPAMPSSGPEPPHREAARPPAWGRPALAIGVAVLALATFALILRPRRSEPNSAPKPSAEPTPTRTNDSKPSVIESPPEPLLLELVPVVPGAKRDSSP